MSPTIEALRRADGDGGEILATPTVGLVSVRVRVGSLLVPGDQIGWLRSLGRRLELTVPVGVVGRVSSAPAPGWGAMAYGDLLAQLEPIAAGEAASIAAEVAATEVDGNAFRAPSAGRVFSRPAPDAEAFLAVGAEIVEGQPVALLEVMKTFSRVTFKGAARARVTEIVASNESDVSAGDVIFRYEVLP